MKSYKTNSEKGSALVMELFAMALGLILMLAVAVTIEAGIDSNNLNKQRAFATSIAEGLISRHAIINNLTPESYTTIVHGVTYNVSMSVSTVTSGNIYKARVDWGYTTPIHNLEIQRLVSGAR